MVSKTQRIRSLPNAERDERTRNNLAWLESESPTDAEADAYLRGKGIIKKCEVCGQDAMLTNEFVARIASEYQRNHAVLSNASSILSAALAGEPELLNTNTIWDAAANCITRYRVAVPDAAVEPPQDVAATPPVPDAQIRMLAQRIVQEIGSRHFQQDDATRLVFDLLRAATLCSAPLLDGELAEAQRLYEAIPEGEYFVSFDDGDDCPNHANSGLAVVDTGRANDWPIARHCHWPVAKWIAAAHKAWPQLVARLAQQEKDE